MLLAILIAIVVIAINDPRILGRLFCVALVLLVLFLVMAICDHPAETIQRPTLPLQFDNVNDATNFSKNAKSGALFDVKDSEGIIHHMRVD